MLSHGPTLALLVCVVLAGCKSHPLGPYVSPCVEGQVVHAETGQALPGVKVTRGKPPVDTLDPNPKGGQLLMTKSPAQTGSDGRFLLPSERVLSIVRGFGWNEVRLTFVKRGFQTLHTNFPTALATNLPSGEPLLNVGLVGLWPEPTAPGAAQQRTKPVSH